MREQRERALLLLLLLLLRERERGEGGCTVWCVCFTMMTVCVETRGSKTAPATLEDGDAHWVLT